MHFVISKLLRLYDKKKYSTGINTQLQWRRGFYLRKNLFPRKGFIDVEQTGFLHAAFFT